MTYTDLPVWFAHGHAHVDGAGVAHGAHRQEVAGVALLARHPAAARKGGGGRQYLFSLREAHFLFKINNVTNQSA